jgi:hypothetical protein
MGKLETGILGKSRGKIGPVITAGWKSLNVVKTYFKPANPRTPDQEENRNRFSKAVQYARSVLSSICRPIWDKLSNLMSGYNLVVQELMLTMDSDDKPTLTTKFSKGILQPLQSVSANKTSSDINLNWSNNSGTGNALANDQVGAVVYDKTIDKIVYSSFTSATRSSTGANIVPQDYNEDHIYYVYLFARQLTESGFIYSDSIAVQAEV